MHIDKVKYTLVSFKRKWCLDHNLGIGCIHCSKVVIASKTFLWVARIFLSLLELNYKFILVFLIKMEDYRVFFGFILESVILKILVSGDIRNMFICGSYSTNAVVSK